MTEYHSIKEFNTAERLYLEAIDLQSLEQFDLALKNLFKARNILLFVLIDSSINTNMYYSRCNNLYFKVKEKINELKIIKKVFGNQTDINI